jgi:hypothetical protein
MYMPLVKVELVLQAPRTLGKIGAISLLGAPAPTSPSEH